MSWWTQSPTEYKKNNKPRVATPQPQKEWWQQSSSQYKGRDTTAQKVLAKPKPKPPAKKGPSVLQRVGQGINTGLRKFNAASDAILDPFMEGITLGGTKLAQKAGGYLADKTKQVFGETPAQRDARHKKIAQREEQTKKSISPTTRKVLGTIGDVAGVIGGVGTAQGIAKATVGKAITKAGAKGVAKRALTEAGTGAVFEGTRAATEGKPVKEVAKSAGKGALLFGVAGTAGSLVGAGAKRTLPKLAQKVAPLADPEKVQKVAHYTGNALKGATTGAGFAYGGNALEGQSLDHESAAKNALAFGALEILTGGKYKNISKDYEMLGEVNKAYAKGAAQGVRVNPKNVMPPHPAPKNTALENAVNKYQSAKQAVEKRFGIVPGGIIRTDEIARAKTELGIDLNKLRDNISAAKPAKKSAPNKMTPNEKGFLNTIKNQGLTLDDIENATKERYNRVVKDGNADEIRKMEESLNALEQLRQKIPKGNNAGQSRRPSGQAVRTTEGESVAVPKAVNQQEIAEAFPQPNVVPIQQRTSIKIKGKTIDVTPPVQPQGKKERGFVTTLKESPKTAPEVKAEVKGAYDPITNKETLNRANQRIQRSIEQAVTYVKNTSVPSAEHTATAIRLIDEFQKKGNYERAVEIAEDIAAKLTKEGQAIQAASMWGRLSPEGILVTVQKHVSKLNQGRWLPKLTKEYKLTPELAQNFKQLAEKMKNAPTEDAKIEISMELQEALQALKKPGIGRKISTAQTIAQLANTKTIVRNLVGNELFYRLERVNKYVATPIDWAKSLITGGERTVTFRTAGQTGYWQAFFTGAKAGWKGVNPSGIQTQFEIGAGQSFRGKYNPLAYLEKALGATLKGFDHAAYKRAYNQTIGELATLRALNQGLKGQTKTEAIQKFVREADVNMKDIADQYGKYVTFQDNNVLSRGLSKVKQGLNLGQGFGLGDLVIKYPKTPGALIMRGMEYSPAGFMRSAYIAAKPILRGAPPDSREALLSLSRAITGSLGFSGLGYFLADKGVITGIAPTDKDLRELQRQSGEGAYKVNGSALVRWVLSGFDPAATEKKEGDKLFSYDWMQPIAMAISFGANINTNIKEAENPLQNTSATIASSLEGAISTILEQPVLQGLLRLFQGYELSENLTRTGQDLPASFVPTLANQMRQYGDNTARLTYDPSKLKETVNKAKVKIPGQAGELPVAYDTLGNPKENYQSGTNTFFNVFLNPAFVSKYKVSPEAQQVIKLFKETGETKQIPRVVNKYIMAGGKKIDLTPDEYSELQRMVGEYTRIGFGQIDTSMSAEDQIKEMVSILNKAGKFGRDYIKQQRGLE